MRFRTMGMVLVAGLLASGASTGVWATKGGEGVKPRAERIGKKKPKVEEKRPAPVSAERPDLDPFVERGAAWLVKAQHPNGGWGAGSHARQDVRDPRLVTTDPGTTAFVAMALLRTGSTPTAGPYRETLKRATLHLLEVVENAPANGPRITQISGTQLQAKLGPLVDTGMTAQYLARVLPAVKGTDLQPRVDAALERCVRKLEDSQSAAGNWNSGGGWAPVLESSVSTSALEMAQAAGKKVDAQKLEKAREYQKGNYDAATGRAASRDSAGVELYAFSSAQRANAADAREAQQRLEEAKSRGDLPASAPVTADNLQKAGVDARKARSLNEAYEASRRQRDRMAEEQLLSGFGSNGGEEYLSYLQTSESLVLAGDDEWVPWKKKMTARLEKIQGNDGSWTGHHCITSPVFCTAAVLQTLTADRDTLTRPQVARGAARR